MHDNLKNSKNIKNEEVLTFLIDLIFLQVNINSYVSTLFVYIKQCLFKIFEIILAKIIRNFLKMSRILKKVLMIYLFLHLIEAYRVNILKSNYSNEIDNRFKCESNLRKMMCAFLNNDSTELCNSCSHIAKRNVKNKHSTKSINFFLT